jgi:hypothetical protein
MSEQSFPEPNYTQAPNLFFDRLLAEIDSLSELKVTLIIIRNTCGWRRTEHELSVTEIEKLTGLSRRATFDGIEKALARGYVYRKQRGQSFVYGLLVQTLHQLEKDASANPAPVTSANSAPALVQTLHPPPYKKKRIKESKKERDSHTHEVTPSRARRAHVATDEPTEKRVCVDGSNPQSKYSLEDRERYARNHPLTNPGGWLAASETGKFDSLVGPWLARNGRGGETAAAPRDVSSCPDCSGSGWYYPNGYDKGTKKCNHEKLSGGIAA